MLMTVSLYADSNLKDNVKYRSGGLNNSTLIATLTPVVSNGTLANENIFDDNSIEISTNIDTAARANYILLNIGNTAIAGEIVGLNYINDNNTEVQYTVDYFTTAQMTNALRPGFFSSCFGHCERTNITYPSESVVNQQSEPFGGNDLKVIDTELTQKFNDAVYSYTNARPENGTFLLDSGYSLVLWISPWAASALIGAGVGISRWATPSPPTGQNVNEVDYFGEKFTGDATKEWNQSFTTGVPLVFQNSQDLTAFIDGMLSNVGERIEIDPYGFETDGVMKRYVNMDTQFFYSTQEFTEEQGEEMANVPMTQVKMITDIDILRIQIIPTAFCQDAPGNYQNFPIDTGYGLHNFNPLRDERDTILPDGTIVQDFSKSKLMTYPYWYHELVTRVGNNITLLPQNNMHIVNYLNDGQYRMKIRFVGGQMPKLMIAMQNKEDWGSTGFAADAETLWHTIYEYPSVPWANNVSSQQQIAELEARMQRVGQQQSAVIGASVKGTGFMYGFRGGQAHAGQGWFRQGMTKLGGLLNFRTGNGGTAESGETGAILKRSEQADLDSKTATENAGRIIDNQTLPILGEGSIEMLYSQPLTCYRCGMTDGELYGLARFIERRGQTCHLNINPITNGGDVFSGNASFTSYGGKQYYEFYDLDVVGTMPITYKNSIQMMFCGGCYLIG